MSVPRRIEWGRRREPTLEGMHDEVHPALKEELFKLFGPQGLAFHLVQSSDLVLVAGRLKGVDRDVNLWKVFGKVRVDNGSLCPGEDRIPCSDYDPATARGEGGHNGMVEEGEDIRYHGDRWWGSECRVAEKVVGSSGKEELKVWGWGKG